MTDEVGKGRVRRRRLLGGLGATGVPHYVWHCWHAGYVRCQCCEAKDPYGATIASAYSCQ